MSNKGVCRTAPATPGLFNIVIFLNLFQIINLLGKQICLLDLTFYHGHLPVGAAVVNMPFFFIKMFSHLIDQ